MAAAVGRADPGEFGPVELDLFASGYLRHDQRATDGAQGESIGFSKVKNMIRRDHRTRTGHVLHNELRIAGNMLGQESSVSAHPLIVVVARLVSDQDTDRFSPV